MKQKAPPLIATVLTLLVAGCSKNPSLWGGVSPKEIIDAGKITSGTYYNPFFEFAVKLPPDWKVLDPNSLKETGAIHLFAISKYGDANTPQHNADLSCSAFSLRTTPNVITGADYLAGVKDLIPPDITITQDITTQQIGGRRFAVMRTDRTKNNMTVHQVVAATAIPGWALVCFGSYGTDDEQKEVQQVLDSIKFDQ